MAAQGESQAAPRFYHYHYYYHTTTTPGLHHKISVFSDPDPGKS